MRRKTAAWLCLTCFLSLGVLAFPALAAPGPGAETEAGTETETQTQTAGSPITLEPGQSYFEYQWAFKNDGRLQRTSSYGIVGFPVRGRGNRLFPGEFAYPVYGVQYRSVRAEAGIDINLQAAWQYYLSSPQRRPVTVALIDTGVDISHSELAGAVWVNADEIPGDGIDNDGNGYVDDVNGWNFWEGNNQVMPGAGEEHGTHGAGTIAAAWDGSGTFGIADGNWVKIMVLRVMGGEDGVGASENVKAAIRYARDNGADICNLSLGTSTYDPELEQLIRETPMLFVAAAGNGDAWGRGYDVDKTAVYPAAYQADNLISVANLMFDGTLEESSNYGAAGVDLAAPGTYILSTVPGGYDFMSGTSMAAPMVTGVAALVYSCRTDLDLPGVRQAILSGVRPLEGLAGSTVTGGMLDAWGAITWGEEGDPQAISPERRGNDDDWRSQ